ncbi:MAG: transposase, partial [Phycisphaerae bacterium]
RDAKTVDFTASYGPAKHQILMEHPLKALGLNLVERSSGQYVGRLHISKRGSPEARRWLYLSALRQLEDPAIERWYAAKVKRDGGRRGKAVTGVMRKLALGIYHCCRTGEAFSNEHVFQNRRSGRHRRRRRRMGALMAGVSVGKADGANGSPTEHKGVAAVSTAARAAAKSHRGFPGDGKPSVEKGVSKPSPTATPIQPGITTAIRATIVAESGTEPQRRSRR